MAPSSLTTRPAMTLDEFLAAIADEPAREVVRSIRAASPALLRTVERAGGMLLSEFVAGLPEQGERTVVAYYHLLGPGLDAAKIAAWQEQQQAYPLPEDLRLLLRRVNGVHLWADSETGRAYTGLAPLGEWQSARAAMYGANADSALVSDRYLAISYHQDGGAYVVLDAQDGAYFLMDPAGPDRGSMIASCVPELLAWLWCSRLLPSEG